MTPKSPPTSTPAAAPASQPPTLAVMLERVGGSLVSVVSRSPRLNRPVTGIAIYDAVHALEPSAGHVLLGVGVDPNTPVALELVAAAKRAGCAAVVVRTDGNVPADLITSARQEDVLLLRSSSAVSWVHLATMLRMSVGAGTSDAIAGLPIGDLFGFVNAVASNIGGAVSLEDADSRVMAYSVLKGDVDEPRKLTILGRQIPPAFMDLLNRLGVMDALLSTDEIVQMDAMPELGLQRRLVVSVRAAGELLGFLWAAEAGAPLAPNAERILREASQAAALHIVRERMNQRNDSEIRREVLRELLDGEPSPDVSIARLGLRHEVPYCVIAFEAIGSGISSEQTVHAVETYCSTYTRGSYVASVGMRVYALVPGLTNATVRSFASAGIERVQNALHAQVYAAFCDSPRLVDHIQDMRTETDRAMRVLLREADNRTFASLDDVRSESALMEILDFLHNKPHLLEGRLSRLLNQPSPRDQALIDTLTTFLDLFGDIPASAAAMNIHPNTFRYRLARVVDVTGIDLGNASQRLIAQLQLKVAARVNAVLLGEEYKERTE